MAPDEPGEGDNSQSVREHHSTGTSTSIRGKKQTSKTSLTTGGLGSGVLLQTAPKSSAVDVSRVTGLAGVGGSASVVVANVVPDSPAVIERSVSTAKVGESGAGRKGKGRGGGGRGGVLRLLGSSVTANLLHEGAGNQTSADLIKGSQRGGRKKSKGRKKGQTTQQDLPKTSVSPAVTTPGSMAPRKPFESDWDSSEGEEEMPFLDSSFLPRIRSPGIHSASSWESSHSEGGTIGELAVGAAGTQSGGMDSTPNFLADINMEDSLGEGFEASEGEEPGAFEFKKGPRDWLSDSGSSSDSPTV